LLTDKDSLRLAQSAHGTLIAGSAADVNEAGRR
jgi:hypothetical protein